MKTINICALIMIAVVVSFMGFIVFIFMRYCFDWLKCFFESWDTTMLVCSSLILGVALTIDMIYNLNLMYKTGSGKLRWKIVIKKKE